MIDQLKSLLKERRFAHAVIIDDAYDDRPRPGDIGSPQWDRFFDDLNTEDEARLSAAYGAEKYEAADVSMLSRDQQFVDLVWTSRAEIGAAADLFGEFEHKQGQKREQLAPLQALLGDQLELTCTTHGREDDIDLAKADLVFLDLFLGYLDDEDAIGRAVERVKAIMAQRRTNPPSIVLLSVSPRLEEVGPRLRDDGELLGCQFRMMKKAQLTDADFVVERLYELTVSYPDALRLNAFLLAWTKALDGAKTAFLRSIRTLDLRDYANMQELILEAEDELVGDYILDLYDLHLHNVLEGDKGLVLAAKALNKIDWTQYPPAQFMPSPEAVGIMDGALFHNQHRTSVEAEIENDPTRVRLGDVYLGPESAPAAGGQDAPTEEASQFAFVVMSQACDLQHGQTDRLILLRGRVRPYGWKQHDSKTQTPRTSIMMFGDRRLSVEWDLLAPETWLLADLVAKGEAGFARVRRFRTPFALQLQQAFIGKLGRVGTLAALPGQYRAGVRVFLRDLAGKARLLAEAHIDADKAMCLVGRTQKNALKEWLLLSDGLLVDLRRTLREVPAEELPTGSQIATIRDDPAFYRRLKSGLLLNRSPKGSKPFKDTGPDVIQIVTQKLWEPDGIADRSYNPILIEVDFGLDELQVE